MCPVCLALPGYNGRPPREVVPLVVPTISLMVGSLLIAGAAQDLYGHIRPYILEGSSTQIILGL